MDGTAEIITRDGELRIPLAVADHAAFRAWVTSDEFPEKLRATFVSGEILLDMSPEEIEGHAKVKKAITSTLDRIAEEEEDLGEVYPDGTLLTNEAAQVSSEPDAMFVSWKSFDEGRVRLTEKRNREDRYVEVVGTPDLVVEAVSDSSVRKDLKLLRAAYARAGIPEYWIIDARRDVLHFEILSLRDVDYVADSPRGESQRSVVFARDFRLERVRNRAGRFRYRLLTA